MHVLAIQPSHPLLTLPFLPSIFLSISPSNEYSGLISFRIDWFDLLAFHRTLKSLLQHHSSKASVLQHSAFFMVLLWQWVGFRAMQMVKGVSQMVIVIKNPPANAGDIRDVGSIPGPGRSPEGGHNNPL